MADEPTVPERPGSSSAPQPWDPPSSVPARPPTHAAAPAPPQYPAAPAAGSPTGLPPRVEFASPWLRLGAYLLEGLLVLVTLVIGWIIWALTIGGDGQTPAKRLLGMRVIRSDRGRPAGLGWMFWMRGLVAPFIAGFVVVFTLGIILLMPFWDRRNQNIWDKLSNCYVVTDPYDAYGIRRA